MLRHDQDPGGPLVSFAVYDHPLDYPGHYVVRRFVGDEPTADFAIELTLGSIRLHIPPGMYRLERLDGDDPYILETWI